MKREIPSPVQSIHHVALEVNNMKKSVEFYRNVLRLPDARMPEAVVLNNVHWFQLSEGQMLHLSPQTKPHSLDRSHLALSVSCVKEWTLWLEEQDVELIEPRINICQITRQFFRDPSGNLIELIEADKLSQP